MGIAVLGGFIIYIVITLVVLAIAVKFVSGKKRKWISALLVVLTSILIPTWDIPIGRINFNNLCKTQAGQFIYKQVPLSDEYFLKEGERDLRYQHDSHPLAYAKGGELNLERVKQEYVINTTFDRNYSRWGYIFMRETTIASMVGKKILSRAVSFYYRGGWIMSSFEGGSSIYCPSEARAIKSRPYSIHSNLPDKTFKKIFVNGESK